MSPPQHRVVRSRGSVHNASAVLNLEDEAVKQMSQHHGVVQGRRNTQAHLGTPCSSRPQSTTLLESFSRDCHLRCQLVSKPPSVNIMMASGQTILHTATSMLLSIPAEVRTRILSMLLALSPSSKRPRCPAILLVCKSIYQEARLLVFQTSQVAVPPSFGTNTSLTLSFLLGLTRDQIKAIRHISLVFLDSASDVEQAAKTLRLLSNSIEEHHSFNERPQLSLQSDLQELNLDIVCSCTEASGVRAVCDIARALGKYTIPDIQALKGFTKLRKVNITLQLRNLAQATAEQKSLVTASVSKMLPGCVTNLHIAFTQANDTGQGGMKPPDMAAMAARIRQEAFEGMERCQATGAIGALRAFPWKWEGD